MKKRRWPLVLAAALLIVLSAWYIRVQYYGIMTCGTSEADIVRYVEQMVEGKEIDGLRIAARKFARQGRMQAVLYEEYRENDPEYQYRYVIFFERQLFGLRLRHTGMNTWDEGTLSCSGSWSSGSRCDLAVYGGNRSGAVASYEMTDAPEVHRENLESDYILDIYILDGIGYLPRNLQQEFSEAGRV